MQDIKYIFWGIAFGILLTKADLISWFRIKNMFLFKEAHLYLVIFSAIATAALAVFLIRHFKLKTLAGQEIVIEREGIEQRNRYRRSNVWYRLGGNRRLRGTNLCTDRRRRMGER